MGSITLVLTVNAEFHETDSKLLMNEVVYLTLGDGDFTFSLDLAFYLSRNAKEGSPVRLIATGFDTLDELTSKYQDSAFVLRNLRVQGNTGTLLSVEIHHGVNAIVTNVPGVYPRQEPCYHADLVIFNHPHLGVEDQNLHSNFLCHMFHSVANFWLRPGGLFYLTLAQGQYERWACEQAAHRHNMTLLFRAAFQAPQVSEPRYEYRRHQTGKSFATRITRSSDTFVYGRKEDPVPSTTIQPPWYEQRQEEIKMFPCPQCGKYFREQRSVDKHTRSKHEVSHEDRKDHDVDSSSLVCNKCPNPRVFLTEQALGDHIDAKHRSLRTNLRRDMTKSTANLQEPTASWYCDVCGLRCASEADVTKHHQSLVPETTEPSFSCTFCTKIFLQQRDQFQHENTCRLRRPIVVPSEGNDVHDTIL